MEFKIKPKIDGYLYELVKLGGSDLHIKANSPIFARINGDIMPITTEVLSKEDALQMAKEFLRSRFDEFVKNKDIDLVYVLNENYRFRVNIFFQIDGVSAVFRVIPVEVKTIDELYLPQTVKEIAKLKRGLVLVTGITGSGKSTTMAAMIDEVNRTRAEHVITIEDPVEFVHKNKKAIINQRSLGQDTPSFSSALKASLREDPDIIVVGEMRDLETIEMALHAAETGHLVLSTLHTLDAKETINRIISVFPTTEQNRIRIVLASVLEAIISQRLLKTKDGGRRAALEILRNSERVASLIEEGRDSEITDVMEEGEIYGMQTFNKAIFELYKSGVIDRDEALKHAANKNDLLLMIKEYESSVKSFVGNEDEDIIDLKL